MTSPGNERNKRERGILSSSDRDYLLGTADYSRQAAHGRRREIVARTANAIRDFWLLADRLDDDLVERIVDEISVDGEWHEPDPMPPELAERDPSHVRAAPKGFHHGVVDAIALLYRLYDDEVEWFEQLVAEGTRAGIVRARGGLWTVDVDIDATPVETADLGEAIEKFEHGELSELSNLERETLLFEAAAQDALDLDALRGRAAEDEKPASRADETLDTFRDRLPIGHEISRLRHPATRPRRGG